MSRSTDSKHLAVAVLAAGASRRFGDADKLRVPFRGSMLGLHAVRAIPRELFGEAWVIAANGDHPCRQGWESAGFILRENPFAAEGMGTSVALAAQLAQEAQSDGLLIALADMPLVPREHFAALAQAAKERRPDMILVSCKGTVRMPPAVFGTAHFESLVRLGGDAGARDLLAQGEIVTCPPQFLTDIDTPEALAALQ